ncbi:MAG TPA: EI24 domain-containing protein [Geminicoccaceae bacterium]|nr:EI24 domain-containing protein [Geminicoccaceae bacterium]
MLSDLKRALGQLGDPPVRRCLLISFLTALVTMALLVAGIQLAIGLAGSTGWPWLDWLIRLLGVGGALFGAWLLFPAVISLSLGLLLERVVDAVEARWYPGLPPPHEASVVQGLLAGARLALVALLLNILALPLYLVPGLNLVLFLALNGYLLGREYVELVAQRRMGPAGAAAFRRANRARVWLTGAVIAGLLTVPLVNLVAPVIGIALATHRFHRLRGATVAIEG